MLAAGLAGARLYRQWQRYGVRKSSVRAGTGRRGKGGQRVTVRRIPNPLRGYVRNVGFYNRLRNMMGQEMKFHDVEVASTAPPAGLITDTLNSIPQGTNESERIGRRAVVKKIQCKFHITLPAFSATSNIGRWDVVRVIFYLDKQCNGQAATVLNILETADFQAFNNLASRDRFVKLYDKSFSMAIAGAAGDFGASAGYTAPKVINRTFYKSCDIPIEFNSPTGGLSSIRSNNIGVLLISENGYCDFEGKFRLRFTD